MSRQLPGGVSAVDSFDCGRLEAVFQRCFGERYRTRLQGGAAEPLYRPAPRPGAEHCLYYREDYFASALHEVAHWCIAGEQRRSQLDFGYWYAPDGRSAEQQAAFQAVEIRPQALEWCFSQACGYPFRVSLDNLEGDDAARASEQAFLAAVIAEGQGLKASALPPRAARFFAALSEAFGTAVTLADLQFSPPGH